MYYESIRVCPCLLKKPKERDLIFRGSGKIFLHISIYLRGVPLEVLGAVQKSLRRTFDVVSTVIVSKVGNRSKEARKCQLPCQK